MARGKAAKARAWAARAKSWVSKTKNKGLFQKRTNGHGDNQTREMEKKFTLFPKLPIELRAHIWGFVARQEGRVIDIRLKRYNFYSMSSFEYTTTPNPIILSVCKESRHEALKVYQLVEFEKCGSPERAGKANHNNDKRLRAYIDCSRDHLFLNLETAAKSMKQYRYHVERILQQPAIQANLKYLAVGPWFCRWFSEIPAILPTDPGDANFWRPYERFECFMGMAKLRGLRLVTNSNLQARYLKNTVRLQEDFHEATCYANVVHDYTATVNLMYELLLNKLEIVNMTHPQLLPRRFHDDIDKYCDWVPPKFVPVLGLIEDA